MQGGRPRLRVSGAMLSDTGLVREHNEDHGAYIIPPDEVDGPALAVIADGMGGHAAGEVASGIAVERMTAMLSGTDRPPARIRRAFLEANAAIRARAASDPATAGMGTTCTLWLVEDGLAWLGHIGDSRAYHLRGSELTQASEDHSLVAELVRRGQLTAGEAEASPDRNLLLRALGIDDRVEPQIAERPLALEAGDVLVLCSDGLSDLVDATAISNRVATAEPAMACRALVALALDAGGHDNVSVGVFRMRAAGDGAPDDARLADTREIELPRGPGIGR